MEYIMNLREKVGRAPIISGAAGAIIINENNEILLQQRSDDGTWGNPGGGIELGESLEECLFRETKEETGLIVKNAELFKVYSGECMHVVYPNCDEVYYINAIYIVRDYEGEISIDDGESLQLKFFSLNQIPKPLSKYFSIVLDDLKEYLK